LVFFRETSFYLMTKSQRLGWRGDLYQLKVKIEGEVSRLSGMVINLKDVDVALAQVQKTVTEARNASQGLQLISTFLKSVLNCKVIEIEISRRSNSMVLDSLGLYKKWRSYVLFLDKKIVTSKKCQFFYRGKKPVLPSKPWKSTDAFVNSWKNSPSQISQVWIQNDQVQGFEIYHL